MTAESAGSSLSGYLKRRLTREKRRDDGGRPRYDHNADEFGSSEIEERCDCQPSGCPCRFLMRLQTTPNIARLESDIRVVLVKKANDMGQDRKRTCVRRQECHGMALWLGMS